MNHPLILSEWHIYSDTGCHNNVIIITMMVIVRLFCFAVRVSGNSLVVPENETES